MTKSLRDLRAWWAYKQGLLGSSSVDANICLAQSGWARSVGGSNPYVGLFAREGISPTVVNKALADQEILELPSARGCTYVLPRSHFGLGLIVGQQFSETGGEATSRKFLGLTDAELDDLCAGSFDALKSGPLDPNGIKKVLGDRVRSLGPEGKKRGQSTFLSIALGKLQREGKIRRIPVNGRLDSQSYKYEIWESGPLTDSNLTREQAYIELAKLYFSWIGPAKLSHFQWFSGLGARICKEIIASIPVVTHGANAFPEMEGKDDWYLMQSDLDSFARFERPNSPNIKLVSSLDGLFLLRRDFRPLLDPDHLDIHLFSDAKQTAVGLLADLPNNVISDRGQVIGFWEYDSYANEIMFASFAPESKQLQTEVESVQTMIRTELGDARNFSLDSPESRKPYVDALRKLKK